MSDPIIEYGRREARRILRNGVIFGILVGSVVMYLLSPTKRR